MIPSIVRHPKAVFLTIALSTLLAGCEATPLYHWGEYESLIYNGYTQPGLADANTQIEKLVADIQKADSLGKKVAPGIFAHLAYMYAIEGEVAKSNDAFVNEKSLYPESAKFIDGMMSRATMLYKAGDL